MKLTHYHKAILIIFSVLMIDQLIKYWVKTTLFIGEEIPVFGNWFIIHFTENNGMAFGVELGGSYGKLALSLFRVIAVFGIAYILHQIIKRKYHFGLITCVCLVFAGALGNIIDSVFYGKIYGYENWLHGRVVDMFYFPMIQNAHFPSWFPIWGGEEFEFFRPVFNVADAAISTGVISLFVFQGKFFKDPVATTSESPSNPIS